MTNSQNLPSLTETAINLPEAWMSTRPASRAQVTAPSQVAVIYSRYSTDRQTEMSVERQYEVCAEHISRAGLTLIRHYADRARAGTSIAGRDALDELFKAAQRREFGIVYVENVDRLSRDLSDLSGMFKRLKGLGIAIHQPGRGMLGLPDIAFHGFMGEEGRRLFLDRVQSGRLRKARKGSISSHVSYGYALVPGRPGERIKVPAEAEAVNLVYLMRLEGLTTRQISLAMNARECTGKVWKSMTVRSILSNPLYNGIYVYNQRTKVMDQATGRMVIVTRPRSEWVVVPVDHLTIVDRAVWEAVQTMQQPRKRIAAGQKVPARKYLLSGKLRCPECTNPMIVTCMHTQRRFACSDMLRGGTCKGSATIKLDEIESFMIDFVAKKVLDDRYTEAYVAAYNEAQARSSDGHEAKRAALRREVAGLTRALDGTLDDREMEGFTSQYRIERRRMLSNQLQVVEEELAMLPPTPRPIGLDQRRMTMLREAVEGLRERVPFRPENEADHRLAAAFRELIDRIVVRRPAFGQFEAEIHLTVMPLVEGVDGSVDEGSGRMCLRASYRRKEGWRGIRRWKLELETNLAAERFVLRDHEWDAIRHLLPDALVNEHVVGQPSDARSVVQAHLFILMTGTPFKGLPQRFGSWHITYFMVSKLIVLGVWREVAMVLASLDPDRYEARFADADWKQVKPSIKAFRLVAERRAAEAAGMDGTSA